MPRPWYLLNRSCCCMTAAAQQVCSEGCRPPARRGAAARRSRAAGARGAEAPRCRWWQKPGPLLLLLQVASCGARACACIVVACDRADCATQRHTSPLLHDDATLTSADRVRDIRSCSYVSELCCTVPRGNAIIIALPPPPLPCPCLAPATAKRHCPVLLVPEASHRTYQTHVLITKDMSCQRRTG